MKETLQFLKCCVSYKVLHPILIGEDLKKKKKVKTNTAEQGAKKKDKEKCCRVATQFFQKTQEQFKNILSLFKNKIKRPEK